MISHTHWQETSQSDECTSTTSQIDKRHQHRLIRQDKKKKAIGMLLTTPDGYFYIQYVLFSVNRLSTRYTHLLEENQLSDNVERQQYDQRELTHVTEEWRHLNAATLSNSLYHEVRPIANISHGTKEYRRSSYHLQQDFLNAGNSSYTICHRQAACHWVEGNCRRCII